MAKIHAMMDIVILKAKSGISRFVKAEQGDFGVGQLAAIVAGVVIIGIVVLTITDMLPEMIQKFWSTITDWFDLMVSGA